MERKFAYNYVQDPTSQQGFNRYAYCFYNPLKYVDPSGYRCDNPPYQLQVQQYLMCMNAENAEALNNVGITNVQVNSSQGYSGSYVQYQVAGEWYGFHYNGYVDVGYDDGYGGQTTYSDGSLPTPPTPMYWNEGGGCGGGGTASSGGGFSKPVVPVDGRNNLQTNNICNTPNDQNLVLIGEQKFIHDEFVNTNTDYYLDFKGGQHIRIVLEESNISSQISIRDETTYYIDYVMGIVPRKVFDGNDGMGGNGGDFVLIHSMPQNHDFYRFAECPIDWRIHISTTSKIANVKIYIYSSYVP